MPTRAGHLAGLQIARLRALARRRAPKRTSHVAGLQTSPRSAPSPTPTRRHAPNTSPGCRSWASAPSPAAARRRELRTSPGYHYPLITARIQSQQPPSQRIRFPAADPPLSRDGTPESPDMPCLSHLLPRFNESAFLMSSATSDSDRWSREQTCFAAKRWVGEKTL